MPLFTGGRLVNETRAARARAEQARAQYEQSVLVALREASDALVGVRTARDQVAAQQTQAQALRRALQLAELRYRTGVASYLEVLDAQRSLFDAELALSQAQLRQLVRGGGAVPGAGRELAGEGTSGQLIEPSRDQISTVTLRQTCSSSLADAGAEGAVDPLVPAGQDGGRRLGEVGRVGGETTGRGISGRYRRLARGPGRGER